jgi:hypothetical protein
VTRLASLALFGFFPEFRFGAETLKEKKALHSHPISRRAGF